MSDLLEIGGLVLLAAAVFLWFGVTAFVAAVGVELLLVSVALEVASRRPARRGKDARRPLRRVG